MEEQILRFADQFAWEPEVLRAERLPAAASETIVCGMGGSQAGARLLLQHEPTLPISIHSDYGLPRESHERLRRALVIASSYSGETEETLDAAHRAVDAGLSVAVVTTGGALAAFAEEHSLPTILILDKGFAPRMAVGASMLALARLMRATEIEKSIREAGMNIDVRKGKTAGEALAKHLLGQIPLIYASTLNAPLAHYWKIAINETAKIPAFYNVLPELCHNELSSFGSTEKTAELSARLSVLILVDKSDNPRIRARMGLVRELLAKRNIHVADVELAGGNEMEKILDGVLLAEWTALALARHYGVPDAATPLIDEFKRRMKEV